MDVNNINPVLSAFVDVLPQIGFQVVERQSLALSGSTFVNKGIMVNVGVVGTLKGAIVIGMDIDAAKQFASKMMMGMEVLELDALAQSAVSEMANMVCANACTNFAQAGIVGLDISPPTLIIGKDGQVKLSAPSIIVIKYMVDNIPMDVCVGLF